MKDDQSNYENLKKLSLDIHILKGVTHILDWDQETYMPPQGAGIRSDQLKLLAGIIHKAKTGPAFTKALGCLIDIKSGKIQGKKFKNEQQAALREWRRDYIKAKAIPKKFVEEWAKLTSQTMHIWKHAREANSFSQFSPYLERIIDMARRKADLLGYDEHPYDALLDVYEPDMTIKVIDPLFKNLRTALKKTFDEIAKKKSAPDNFLYGDFSTEKQMEFGYVVLKAVHYDLSKGRLDLSAHPFSSSSHPYDSRITSRIYTNSLMSHISAVLHEAGHALYEMGLPVEEYGTPLGEPISLAVHESQSRWWETRIGQSKAFWKYFLPQLTAHYKPHFDKVTLDQFYKAINNVAASFIRVEADEVTYNLHIILRYELERALIEGTMTVKQIPEAWNAKMQELLGITPTSYREGCLQDIHWSMGAFGYFPTYTLGNLYAAQLFQKFEQVHANWEERVAAGDLLFIKEWLNQNVHKHGRQYSSEELIKLITGTNFSEKPFISYLNKKYTNL